MKFFFDTNILAYLFDAEAGDILLSTQVLQEF